MGRSSIYPRLAPCISAALLCGCSSGSFRATPETSRDEAKLAAPHANAATEPSSPATTDPLRSPAPPHEANQAALLDPNRPRPVLTAELHRLRHAAERQVLGREAPPGVHALPYVHAATGGGESGEPHALGHFVAVENEPALDHFHKALARLVAGQDEDGKVRILAYGASHTQADSYTGYLRAYFQKRFGDGGQGYVLLGRVNKWYRAESARPWHRGLTVHHARYKLDVQDEPLGLFGAAMVGRNGGSYGEIITSKRSPNTRFELAYFKQPDGGEFSVQVDGEIITRIATGCDTPGLGHYSFETSPGRHRIRAQLRGNGPVRLFGISAETTAPGVVVDTLGIGGAQMVHNLRWQEDSWTDALRHRNPDLVTFAYGTNEVMNPDYPLASYERELRAVLARLRKASPDVSCMLLAPFDMPARVQGRWSTHPRLTKVVDAQRRISQELGCGFWDGYAFMGGPGSMHRWVAAKPPLASPDFVHLTRLGYVYAGIAIGDALMRAYDVGAAQWSEPENIAKP